MGRYEADYSMVFAAGLATAAMTVMDGAFAAGLLPGLATVVASASIAMCASAVLSFAMAEFANLFLGEPKGYGSTTFMFCTI